MFERVGRWRVVMGVALGLIGSGVWFRQPALVIAAVIPVGFVAYNALSSAVPVDDQLAVSRSITPQETHPGDIVTVELTIEHVGERTLPDIRVVDGVPAEIGVVDGSPRSALGLRPGDATTVTYSVRARYGDVAFSDPRIRTTSLSGGSIYTADVPVSGDTTLSGGLSVDDVPLTEQTTGSFGSVTTDSGGEGLAFHATREYQFGDPANRIDWRHYAKQRELTTVEYQQEEATEVVVIVDARTEAAVAASDTGATGVELSVYGAAETIDGLLQTQHQVGLVVLGITNPKSGDEFAWVAPGNGLALRSRIREYLDQAVAVRSSTNETDEKAKERPVRDHGDAPETGDGDESESSGGQSHGMVDPAELVSRISTQTQVLMFTPALDEDVASLASTLQTAGTAVTVCSPDVTAPWDAGSSIARIERGVRLATLQSRGLSVIDWGPDEPLPQAIGKTVRPNSQWRHQ